MPLTWKALLLTNILLVAANEDATQTDSYSAESTVASVLFNRQNIRKSDTWIEKMRTYFIILDFDGNEVVRREDFYGLAETYADREYFDQSQRANARQLLGDLFSVYTSAAGKQDDVLMTKELLMQSVSTQCDDPSFQRTLGDALLSLFTPLKLSQQGHFNHDEYRRIFLSLGFVDIRFTESAFVKVDTNHDGLVSFEEYLDASHDYMCSDSEGSTALFGIRS